MKWLVLIGVLGLVACVEAVEETNQPVIVTPTTSSEINKDRVEKLRVIVLPPYDEIANAGTSPDVQQYLQNELINSEEVDLIKFPFAQLMNVSYQNIFDKKYCQPIIEAIECNTIVMSKLDVVRKTGNMTSDKWNLRIRLYNVKTEKQID